MHQPKRAAIYVRISDDPRGEALGVARQEQDCRKLAADKGWGVIGMYRDNDVSAFDTRKQRPEYRRLLRDIESGAVDGVLVYRLDRLHRRLSELETFMTLAESKAIPLATVAGNVDLGSPEGRLMARIMGSVDSHESEVKGARIRRKHLELAQRGKVVGGGMRPLGYTADRLHLHAVEAAMLRDAAKSVLAGDSLYAIAKAWNDAGKPSPTGATWRPSVLRKALCSARVAGQREYDGKLYPAEWPAVLPLATWSRLRRMLCDPARRNAKGPRPQYVLSGLLHCGRCDELLTAHARVGGKRVYVCGAAPGRRNCGKLSVVAAELEELIVGATLMNMDRPRLVAKLRRHERADDDGDAVDAIRADESQLEELAALWADKKIGAAEWLRAREGVEARLRDARARLGASEKSTAVAEYVGKSGALARAWPTLSVDRQRAIVRTIIEKVTVQAAAIGVNAFDPGRVQLAWRY